jgi:serine/threonine-protein kinase
MLGTPHYMSPEQLLGERRLTPASDLWALGIVAYEALTGQRPFAGPTVAALSLAVFHTTPASPCAIVPDLPRALEAWFGRALAIDPEERFSSAREQARHFANAAGEELAAREATLDGPRAAPQLDTQTESGDLCAQTLGDATMRPPRRATQVARGLGALVVLAAVLLGHTLVSSSAGRLARDELQPAAGDPVRATPQSSPPPAAAPTEAVAEQAAAVADASAGTTDAPSESATEVPTQTLPRANTPRAVVASPLSPKRPLRPAHCAGDDAYRRNERGHLVPKTECL